MTTAGTILRRAAMVLVPATLGVMAVLYAGKLTSVPEPGTMVRKPTLVRVVTLEETDFLPRVIGYGTVTPVRDWRAVARIEGEVAALAEGVAPGQIVPGGTVLFRIDDSTIKLDLANIEAQLSASHVRDQTLQASLDLARSDLDLAREDLRRQEQLHAQGVVTQAALETTRRQELTTRTKVIDLQNQLALNAAERAVLQTQRAALERDQSLAEIRAPYELRITALEADLGQFVSPGQVLLSGEGTAAVDIAAQFPVGRIGPLLRLLGEGTQVTDLKARVRLPAADHAVVWKAEVARVGEAIDPATQNAPVVVRVPDPLGQSEAGSRPPLRRNMVVEVELFAPKRPALVVPAEAISDGAVLVVSAENTLERRAVQSGFATGDLAVVTGGLAPGVQLVLTDPAIAMPGMAVKPVEDAARKAEIAASALGQAVPTAKPGSGGGAGKKGAQP
ncbi:hypothetical protein CKO11_00190 [Rhodobacter sp. TJ_12]|uniref:efflux RND transporter periplasmic adaptor subunit n=1 Tax=Rhodobacter sp. TJ_12 TaxID=2029399 RepID=UPI001CBA8083|nr:HlyD family efflux transporter periplasmic adaptor subunit [Rhodobacter sp. TJ_12]MBZ4020877.1 hypothetical protein [Rhodobacter sp. TJ_12]